MAIKEYVWYRGEELVFMGTIDESVKRFGLTKKQLLAKTYPSNIARVTRDALVGFKVED